MNTSIITPEKITFISFSTRAPHDFQVETQDGQRFNSPFELNLKASQGRFEVEVVIPLPFRNEQPAIAMSISTAIQKAVMSQMSHQAGISFDNKLNLGAGQDIQELLNNI